MSPRSAADGHDAPRLVSEFVPGITAQGDDLVVGFEDPIGQPVVAHELPEVFDRIQLGGSRRQRQYGDVGGQLQLSGGVPAGLIHDEDGMGTGCNSGADFGEMGVHRVGIAPRQDQADGFAAFRADGPEDIGPFGALIVRRDGAGSASCPTARDLVLLTYAGFVLEPDFDLRARLEPCPNGFDFRGEFFLNASTANSFWA